MHITLKDISKLIKSFIFLSVLSVFAVTASEEVALRLYGYGSLYWGGEAHKNPEVYELLKTNHYLEIDAKNNQIGPFYKIGDKENQNDQAKLQIYLHLAVKQESESVISTIRIKNNSSQSYYIHRQNLPAIYSISSGNSEYCSDMFLITTKNIRLDYLGGKCEYYDNHDRTSWVIIPPKEMLKLVTKLNNDYIFPKGRFRYNIGTLEFSLVDESWFIRKAMYKHFFSIMNSKVECMVNDKQESYFNKIDSCENYDNDDIEYFLFRSGFHDSNKGEYLFRTNQVVLEIDGNKVTSP